MEPTNPPIPSPPSDEIDLFKLFIKTILVLRKYKVILWASVAISLLVAIGLYCLPKQHYYRTNITASSNLNIDDVMQEFNSLESSFEANDSRTVADKLGISVSGARCIRDFKIESVLTPKEVDLKGNAKTVTQSKLLKITVDFSGKQTNEPESLHHAFADSLRNGIVYNFANNPYIKERFEISKISANEMIKEIDVQMRKLDSLQKIQLRPYQKQGQVIVDNSGKQSFSGEVLNLKRQKLSIDSSLQLNKPIMIMDSSVTQISQSRWSIKAIFLCSLIIIVIGFLIVTIREINSYLSQ